MNSPYNTEHTRTELIRANRNTKSLQGNGFWLFRSVLMDIPPDYDSSVGRGDMHPSLLTKAEVKEWYPSSILMC